MSLDARNKMEYNNYETSKTVIQIISHSQGFKITFNKMEGWRAEICREFSN